MPVANHLYVQEFNFKAWETAMAITKKSLISNKTSKKTAQKKASPKASPISSAKLATAMQTTLKTSMKVGRTYF